MNNTERKSCTLPPSFDKNMLDILEATFSRDVLVDPRDVVVDCRPLLLVTKAKQCMMWEMIIVRPNLQGEEERGKEARVTTAKREFNNVSKVLGDEMKELASLILSPSFSTIEIEINGDLEEGVLQRRKSRSLSLHCPKSPFSTAGLVLPFHQGPPLVSRAQLRLCSSPPNQVLSSESSEGSPIRAVPVQVAHELLNAGHRYLDVRTAEEFASGHIDGAVNIPYMYKVDPGLTKNLKFLEDVEGKFGKDDEIVVMGKRSQMAAEELVAAGFTGVTDMAGGYMAWMRSGMPTTKTSV
ncbi:hypothetical protein L7F22_022147 [Adiantum nelumboides]|nr:hypothetical protein [Adiantum nelumboides]